MKTAALSWGASPQMNDQSRPKAPAAYLLGVPLAAGARLIRRKPSVPGWFLQHGEQENALSHPSAVTSDVERLPIPVPSFEALSGLRRKPGPNDLDRLAPAIATSPSAAASPQRPSPASKGRLRPWCSALAVDVKLEHHPRMVAGPADIKRLNVAEAKPIEIEPVDKRVDSPYRIVLSYVLVKTRREQRHLLAINPLHKARHRCLAANH